MLLLFHVLVVRKVRRLVLERQKTMLSIELQRREYSYQLTEVIYSSWSYMKSKESEFYNELTRLMTEHDSVVRDFVVTARELNVQC